mmetsp:Transcript_15352/g.30174  ORF Transcript_15352/g.30174 Transcript_15352/m.30174 type:complete len:949 (+) Transcript_15352:105-2951(+)|eukprot:CAMPEP_0175121198 /NCGR_PEP_ID=MMETSP0087-20121206/1039_1 /TAXON_ID=136419 /ORGANISM="Unknown Unknown, Strain D1" /LENGTH=948 /DNA_ID=CAMNT_0016402721 /DNA_START=52 /DNA_END=2898 /DNA_ORIENTATION=+
MNGYVYKQQPSGLKLWQKRYLKVGTSELLYAKDLQALSKKSTKSGVIKFSDINAVEVKEDEANGHFTVATSQRLFCFRCGNKDLANHWTASIQSAVFGQVARLSSLLLHSKKDDTAPSIGFEKKASNNFLEVLSDRIIRSFHTPMQKPNFSKLNQELRFALKDQNGALDYTMKHLLDLFRSPHDSVAIITARENMSVSTSDDTISFSLEAAELTLEDLLDDCTGTLVVIELLKGTDDQFIESLLELLCNKKNSSSSRSKALCILFVMLPNLLRRKAFSRNIEACAMEGKAETNSQKNFLAGFVQKVCLKPPGEELQKSLSKQFAWFVQQACAGPDFDKVIKNALLCILTQPVTVFLDNPHTSRETMRCEVLNHACFMAIFVALDKSDPELRLETLRDLSALLMTGNNCLLLSQVADWPTLMFALLRDIPSSIFFGSLDPVSDWLIPANVKHRFSKSGTRSANSSISASSSPQKPKTPPPGEVVVDTHNLFSSAKSSRFSLDAALPPTNPTLSVSNSSDGNMRKALSCSSSSSKDFLRGRGSTQQTLFKIYSFTLNLFNQILFYVFFNGSSSQFSSLAIKCFDQLLTSCGSSSQSERKSLHIFRVLFSSLLTKLVSAKNTLFIPYCEHRCKNFTVLTDLIQVFLVRTKTFPFVPENLPHGPDAVAEPSSIKLQRKGQTGSPDDGALSLGGLSTSNGPTLSLFPRSPSLKSFSEDDDGRVSMLVSMQGYTLEPGSRGRAKIWENTETASTAQGEALGSLPREKEKTLRRFFTYGEYGVHKDAAFEADKDLISKVLDTFVCLKLNQFEKDASFLPKEEDRFQQACLQKFEWFEDLELLFSSLKFPFDATARESEHQEQLPSLDEGCELPPTSSIHVKESSTASFKTALKAKYLRQFLDCRSRTTRKAIIAKVCKRQAHPEKRQSWTNILQNRFTFSRSSSQAGDALDGRKG